MKLDTSEDRGADHKDSSKMDHSTSNVHNSRNEVIANNQKDHSFNGNQNQSFTSGRFTAQANNYVDKVFDKVMGNYTNIINNQSDEGEGEEEEEEATYRQDSSNNQKEHINMNQSIEKRVDVESSIEHSVIKLDNSDQENSLHNASSTSTIRNMANDYVTNMLGGFS